MYFSLVMCPKTSVALDTQSINPAVYRILLNSVGLFANSKMSFFSVNNHLPSNVKVNIVNDSVIVDNTFKDMIT